MRLGNYIGLHVPRPDLTVREEEIDNVLKRMQRRNAVIVHVDEGSSIRKILKSQPIDDDFALDFSECDSLADLRASIREDLEQRRLESVGEKVERELLSQIIDDSDIPVDPVLAQEVSQDMYEDFLDELEENGMSLETYIERSGRTEAQIKDTNHADALFALRSETVLLEIANREGLTVSAEEVAEEMGAITGEEDEGLAEIVAEFDSEDMEAIANEILIDKAMDLVIRNTIFDE